MKGLLVSFSVMMPSMKSQWFKVLWRFWPGLLCLVVTIVGLSCFLNPLITSTIHFSPADYRHILSVACSPDNRLLAIARNIPKDRGGRSLLADNIHSGEIQLIDYASKELIATFDYGFEPYCFTPDSQFVWVDIHSNSKNNHESVIQLLKWDSASSRIRVLFERVIPYDIEDGWSYSPSFRGLHQLGQNKEFTLLSPDCRTLLVPIFREEKIAFDLIDVATGKLRARLELPEIDLKTPYSKTVEADFSQDGKYLLTQTEEPDGDKCRYRLNWFDTDTGKQLRTFLLPGKETPQNSGSGGSSTKSWSRSIDDNRSRLGPVVFISRDMVVAKTHDHESRESESLLGIRIIRPEDQHMAVTELLEPQPDQINWTPKSDPRHFIARLKGDFRVHRTSNSIISFCHPELHLAELASYSVRTLPYHFANVRLLSDGSLLRSFRLPIDNVDPEGFAESHDELKAILPGPHLLLEKTRYTRNDRIRTWIEMIRGWIGQEEHLQTWMLYVFNLQTGNCDFKLPVTTEIEHALLLPVKGQLALFGRDNQGMFILTYDFPLHQPWSLIWTWALGIALAVTLLAEARRLFPWRKRLS